MKKLLGAVLAIGLLQADPAAAFNIKNDTPWMICVFGNRGGYADQISPGQTNQGWALNKTIKISIVPFDASVCVGENGENCTTKCSNKAYTEVEVPPHAQLRISGTTYEPGDVGDGDRKAQWVMWALGAPAKYTWNLQ
ncbi:hypothetical protein [Roseiterribacter gracilis]|uniref:Uncharacterized protein n=1 Tax=Roseiterribacter gracilis TaxID=2812848 RepID=A0A8S8XBI1_9PROT|nr:hypothetical protein TMPK1_23310 [Rhodospirillales bacterium TMPK1]